MRQTVDLLCSHARTRDASHRRAPSGAATYNNSTFYSRFNDDILVNVYAGPCVERDLLRWHVYASNALREMRRAICAKMRIVVALFRCVYSI